MSYENRIDGVFRLTTPLHCASPDKSLADADNETPTMQQRIVTASGTVRLPYFPGNDLRGRLRRKAAKVVLDRITQTKKVSPQLYAGLNAGAISAQPDSSDLTIEEALRAGRNVYMGLFGGGARLLRSRFSVRDLVPVLAETIDANMVPAAVGQRDDQRFTPQVSGSDGMKPLQSWQLVQRKQVLRVDDTLRVLRPEEMERYIEDAATVVGQIQAETLAARESRRASKAQAAAGEIKASSVVKKIDIGNIATFQSILAGTPMYFQLDFNDDTTDGQVGLMLLALRDLVAEQKLGGWSRAGLGQFTADLALTRHGERVPVFTSTTAGAGEVVVLAPAVEPLLEAARNEVEALTAESLMAFFEPRKAVEAEAA